MTLLPNSKIFFSIGSLHITWYALLIMVGIVFVYKQTCKTVHKWGYSTQIIDDLLLPIGLSILVGARAYYVLFEWDFYSMHPEEIIAVWHGGLAIHGAILGGISYLFWYCKKHDYSFLRMCDVIFPNVLLAQAIGRWGNFMNQEAYGRIVPEQSMRWFPEWFKNQMWIDGAYRQPTFFYESILNVAAFLFIVFIFRKKFYKQEGDCASMYLICYGSIRFWIESMRTDALMLGSWKMAQIVSVIFICIGIIGILTKRKNHPKPTVLFDLDGTLIDSKSMIFETFRRVFKDKLPEHILSEEELNSFFGPTLEVTFKKYFKEEEIEDMIQYYQVVNLDLHEKYLKNMPGAIETVQALKKYGCKVGIVSNKRHHAVEVGLKYSHLAPYMDLVFGKEDLPRPKPEADGLLEACNQLNANYDTCIYIGDNPSDIMAAKNMAAYSVGYSNDAGQIENLKKVSPCKMVDHLSEIVDLCKKDRMWRDFSIW